MELLISAPVGILLPGCRHATHPESTPQKGHSPKTSSIDLCLPCISAADVWAGVKCPSGISCASARKKVAIASTVIAWRRSEDETLSRVSSDEVACSE